MPIVINSPCMSFPQKFYEFWNCQDYKNRSTIVIHDQLSMLHASFRASATHLIKSLVSISNSLMAFLTPWDNM